MREGTNINLVWPNIVGVDESADHDHTPYDFKQDLKEILEQCGASLKTDFIYQPRVLKTVADGLEEAPLGTVDQYASVAAREAERILGRLQQATERLEQYVKAVSNVTLYEMSGDKYPQKVPVAHSAGEGLVEYDEKPRHALGLDGFKMLGKLKPQTPLEIRWDNDEVKVNIASNESRQPPKLFGSNEDTLTPTQVQMARVMSAPSHEVTVGKG